MSHPSKKALFLITKSNFGGAQKYVFELAARAEKEGYLPVVACGGTGERNGALGLLAEKLNAAGIRVVPVKHFMRNVSLGEDVRAFFEILALLRKERPDVLHISSSKAGALGTLAGRIARVPRIIFTSHGLTMDEEWRPRWQRLLITLATWATLTMAHVSIMISSDTHKRARALPGLMGKVVLIKNGIAPLLFMPQGEARERLAPFIPAHTTWIGGIGELHPNKNWQIAIEALATLPSYVHLVIIGEGEERLKLESLITDCGVNDRVHLLGYIDDAKQYLAAFDMFVLPSLKEGLPYVLLEAGLAGLPVIASDLPGNRDIIETGTHGFLIEPTPTVLRTSLEILIRDEGMRRRLGAALQAHITETFSLDAMVHHTFRLYDSSSDFAS